MADTGLFSVRRPRETLGGLNHNGSAIPLPSSALKRSNSISNMQAPHTGKHARSISGSRMSLAPGRPNQPVFQRSSSGSNLAEMGNSAAHRSSNIFSAGGNRRGPGVPATPVAAQHLQQSTERRSSVYSARRNSTGPISRQSFFATAPVPAGVPKDPRPLKDRVFQAQIAQELMQYLTHNNFEMEMKHSLTQNSLKSPTQKDFNYMFQWIYHRIDPSYRFQKNIDAEVPPILKQLRYPFEKSITKSQIAAVGGQNWSTFLGMLHWMMQLARMMDQFNTGGYDDACVEAGFDVSGDRIIFDFLTDAYHTWLSVEDDQEDNAEELLKPHVEKMAKKFDEANEKYIEQAKMLEAEHKSLQDRIDELAKSGPKISELDEQIKLLEEDQVKFLEYNANMDGKVDKYNRRIQLIDEEIAKYDAELQEIEAEHRQLQAMVDRQGIKVEDIDRLNAERERLQNGVKTTNARLEESKRNATDKETDAAVKLEVLEKAVREYNSLAYQISIIPSSAVRAKGRDYELQLSINPGPDFSSSRSRSRPSSAEQPPDRLLADASSGYQPQHLLNLDVKGGIKNGLLALRREISERKNVAAEEDMKQRDTLEKVREAIEDKQQEVDGLGYKVRAAEGEFEKTRENNNAQKMASDAQIEKLEKELARMRTSLTESLQLMEQREMNTNIEYEQLTLRAAALREELHTEVERMLNDIIRFKVHVQKSLEDYEQFVAEEVEAECEEQEGQEYTGMTGITVGDGRVEGQEEQSA